MPATKKKPAETKKPAVEAKKTNESKDLKARVAKALGVSEEQAELLLPGDPGYADSQPSSGGS